MIHVPYSAILMVMGIIALAAGLIWTITALWPRILAVSGLTFILVAFLANDTAPSSEPYPPSPSPLPSPSPQPGPSPSPGPVPDPIIPQPTGPLGQQAAAVFTGTKAEAQTLAALFIQYAEIVRWDAQRPQPKLQTSRDLWKWFGELQKYRGLSESPWGQKFTVLEQLVLTESTRVGVLSPQAGSVPLTPELRAAAASMYQEIGAGLIRAGS